MAIILIVDDEKKDREKIRTCLEGACQSIEAADGAEALNLVKKKGVDLILLDITMPKMNGFQVLEAVKKFDPSIQVIMVSHDTSIETGFRSAKLGAFQYVTKIDVYRDKTSLQIPVKRALEARKMLKKEEARNTQEVFSTDDIISQSPLMEETKRHIRQAAKGDIPVLISGENGTGKELVARAIHWESARRNKTLVIINCGAIANHLIESELFGHEKGAFTGADTLKLGRFELADGGSLFLDELGNLPLDLQPKLLRVVEGHGFERVGGTETVKTNVRIISATNKDLPKAVQEGRFLPDLFHRLNGFPLILSPLRERKEDIPLLVAHFLQSLNQKYGETKEISASFLEACQQHHWPGNVRELQLTVAKAYLMSEGEMIDAPRFTAGLIAADAKATSVKEKIGQLSFKEMVQAYEKEILIEALNRSHWVQSHAAALLQMEKTTLHDKKKAYHLEDPSEVTKSKGQCL